MKKFISGLIVGVLLTGTVSFAASNLTAIKSAFSTTLNGKKITQNVVTINGVYYADLKQLTGNMSIKYSVDAKLKQIRLGEISKKSLIEFSNINYNYDLGYITVNAEAKNKDTEAHTFTYLVSLYDKNKKLLGVGNGTLLGVDPGETVSFMVYIEGEYKTVESVKIQIDQLI